MEGREIQKIEDRFLWEWWVGIRMLMVQERLTWEITCLHHFSTQSQSHSHCSGFRGALKPALSTPSIRSWVLQALNVDESIPTLPMYSGLFCCPRQNTAFWFVAQVWRHSLHWSGRRKGSTKNPLDAEAQLCCVSVQYTDFYGIVIKKPFNISF